MVMNEKEVREECVKLAELSGRLLRQHNDLEKVVAGAKKKEELLLDHIYGMCEMIYYQVPLDEQDDWMETMIEQGYYKKPDDDE